MRVGDDRALYRTPGIDVKPAGLAVEAGVRQAEHEGAAGDGRSSAAHSSPMFRRFCPKSYAPTRDALRAKTTVESPVGSNSR